MKAVVQDWMEVLDIRFEGKKEDVHWIQFLVPLRHVSLNINVCSHRHSSGIGYRDKELPLDKRIFLDGWDIMNSHN